MSDYLDRHFDAMKKLDANVGYLSYLAEALHDTGQEVLADKIAYVAKGLRGATEEARLAFRDSVDAYGSAVQEGTENMMNAVLGLSGLVFGEKIKD